MLATAVDMMRFPVGAMLAQGRAGVHAPNVHVPPSGGLEIDAPLGVVVSVLRDGEIFTQGDAARFCWQVESGCVRTVTLLEDGRRQIGAFLLPGDLLGWDAAAVYSCSAEAVTHTTLRRFRLATIERQADTDPVLGRQLRRYAAGEMRAARSHAVLLGRKTAVERVASFLLEMQQRLHAIDANATVMDLPMSRVDMADYLGLTIETVCRGLTDLRRGGAIEVARARIVITDRNALATAGSDVTL